MSISLSVTLSYGRKRNFFREGCYQKTWWIFLISSKDFVTVEGGMLCHFLLELSNKRAIAAALLSVHSFFVFIENCCLREMFENFRVMCVCNKQKLLETTRQVVSCHYHSVCVCCNMPVNIAKLFNTLVTLPQSWNRKWIFNFSGWPTTIHWTDYVRIFQRWHSRCSVRKF